MQTFQQLQDELKARLMVAASSTLFTPTRIAQLIQNAYIWAAGQFNWPQLEKAMLTNTFAGYFYYDYPLRFRNDSLTRLTVNDLKYKLIAFDDWLDFKEENPNSTERFFADYARQYFIFPTPTADGDKNISIWGIEEATGLLQPGDETIFSRSDDRGNEATVKKAFSVGIKRIDAKLAQAEEAEAVILLTNSYADYIKKQQKYQRKDHPFLEVPDFFKGNGGTTERGSFNS